jgi:hypothetical protein
MFWGGNPAQRVRYPLLETVLRFVNITWQSSQKVVDMQTIADKGMGENISL